MTDLVKAGTFTRQRTFHRTPSPSPWLSLALTWPPYPDTDRKARPGIMGTLPNGRPSPVRSRKDGGCRGRLT